MILQEPLLFLFVTVSIYYVATMLYQKTGRIAFLQPILVSILFMGTLLLVFEIPYESYKEKTVILHSLLDPAIVTLAVPLFLNLQRVHKMLPVLLITVLLCSILIIYSSLFIGGIAGLEQNALLALTTKSVSAPIALNIADKIGSDANLVIFAVFATGIPGVIITPFLLKLFDVQDDMIKGFTLGVTSHAFGVARSGEISNQAAAFATLGMGTMGCITAFLVPIILSL